MIGGPAGGAGGRSRGAPKRALHLSPLQVNRLAGWPSNGQKGAPGAWIRRPVVGSSAFGRADARDVGDERAYIR